MRKVSRKPGLQGGAFEAREIADRMRRAWEAIPEADRPGGKELAAQMGLDSASGWTKRIYPDRKDWVPFRVDELSVLAARFFPGEPWKIFFDPSIAAEFSDVVTRKHILGPPGWRLSPGTEPPPDRPRAASSEQQAGPKRRGRGAG